MSERMIQVFAESSLKNDLQKIADKHEVIAAWSTSAGRGKINFHILADKQKQQDLIDALQAKLSSSDEFHIIIQPIETSLPRPEDDLDETEKKEAKSRILREELEADAARDAGCDRNFLMLVVFSTIVAAIGLIENNVAVVVGAMVIAPFLGPNIALTFAAAMGNQTMALKALKTLSIGTSLAYVLSIALGQFWPLDEISNELHARTIVDYSSIVLALASGAAAVLSLTNGIASILVGVMVAVALLPPLTASGLFLGHGMYQESLSAAILLVVNIVCINLSGLLMFIFNGIGPRTWWQKRKAKQSVYIYSAIWSAMLAALTVVIFMRGQV